MADGAFRMHTLDELHQPPKTEHDEQSSQLSLATAEDDLEHKGSDDHDRIKEVQRRMRCLSSGLIEPPALRPYGDRYFDQEERRDSKGDLGEHFEPDGLLFVGDTVLLQEGVAKVGEDASRVDQDLHRQAELEVGQCLTQGIGEVRASAMTVLCNLGDSSSSAVHSFQVVLSLGASPRSGS